MAAAAAESETGMRSDEYVCHTRPMIARQSWYATMIYIIGFDGLQAAQVFTTGANWDLAMILLAPAAGYLGLRSLDKIKRPSKAIAPSS